MGGTAWAGLLLTIIFLIVFVIGLIYYFVNRSKGVSSPWWVTLMIWGGIALFVIGLIVFFFGISQDSKKAKNARTVVDIDEEDVPSPRGRRVTFEATPPAGVHGAY